MKMAKEQYKKMCEQNVKKYSQAKKIHDEKKKKAISKEEKLAKQKELEAINRRLENAQKNLGKGQATASELEMKRIQTEAQLEIERVEQEKKAAERYQEAIGELRENDPKIQFQKRVKRMEDACATAKNRENKMINQFSKDQKARQEEEEKIRVQQKQAEEQLFKPKLYLEDYAKTYYHAGIGITMPVTHDTVKYGQDIESAVEIQQQIKNNRKKAVKQRTEVAAHRVEVEKNTVKLEEELDKINQLEIVDRLDQLNSAPQNELIESKTYNIDERALKKQQLIQRFLAFNEEAPRPRSQVPKPQPLHMIMNSPVPSDDENDI